jgi:hypothetical protein
VVTALSSARGADRAYIPLLLRIGRAFDGSSGISVAKTCGIAEWCSRVGMTTQTSPWETRRASASAAA